MTLDEVKNDLNNHGKEIDIMWGSVMFRFVS